MHMSFDLLRTRSCVRKP